MKAFRVAVLAGAAFVGACSGGGSGGGGTVVTPTPTPTPSPSPSPSPSPTYTKFADLTGDQTHASTCTGITIGLPPTVYPATLPDSGLTLAYAATPQNWTVTGDGVNLTFTPAERDMTAPATVMAYVKPGTPSQRFSVSVTGAGPVAAEYHRAVSLNAVTPSGPRIFTCVIGVKTLVTDRPAGSTFNFPNARVGGYLFRTMPASSTLTQYSTSNATTTFNVNLDTGKVTAVIRLIATPLPTGSAPDVDLGTVTAVADIDPATGGFYGTAVTSPDFTIPFAQFSGRFFGPQGKEAGLVMTILADKPDGSRYFMSVGGSAIR